MSRRNLKEASRLLLASFALWTSSAYSHHIKVQPFDAQHHLLTVMPDEQAEKMPLALLVLLDISGSMNSPTKPNDENGRYFSRLDNLKHAVNTTYSLLEDQDQFQFLVFGSDYKTVIPMQPVANLGPLMDQVYSQVLGQSTYGCTNLWEAIRKTVQQANKFKHANAHYNVNVLVLTDGRPEGDTGMCRPPNNRWGEAIRKEIQNSGVQLHVVGISTEPEAETLKEIAEAGQGSFAFMYDGATVGDVMVHLTQNMKSTVEQNFRYEGQEFGSLRAGIQRHILVPTSVALTSPNKVEQDVEDRLAFIEFLSQLLKDNPENSTEYVRAYNSEMRQALLTKFQEKALIQADKLANNFAKSGSYELQDELFHSDPEKGQISKAINAWKTWGKMHIMASLRAHQLQEANNQLEPAMQKFFVTPELAEAYARGLEIYRNIKQPLPSLLSTAAANSSYGQASNQGANDPDPIVPNLANTSTCFGADAMVLMNDGSFKAMKDLQVGELVKGGARITHILRSRGMYTLYHYHGNPSIAATPWHPAKLVTQDHWDFPANMEAFIGEGSAANTMVYNLILDRLHVIEMPEGMQFLTLGHGITDDPVAHHAFFGSMEKMNQAFKSISIDGLIEIDGSAFSRDSETGLINAFIGKNLLVQ